MVQSERLSPRVRCGRAPYGSGYVLDESRDMWRHRQTNRMLDPRVAKTMTFEQLLRWIVDGYVP
jgi:hypothetical protein